MACLSPARGPASGELLGRARGRAARALHCRSGAPPIHGCRRTDSRLGTSAAAPLRGGSVPDLRRDARTDRTKRWCNEWSSWERDLHAGCGCRGLLPPIGQRIAAACGTPAGARRASRSDRRPPESDESAQARAASVSPCVEPPVFVELPSHHARTGGSTHHAATNLYVQNTSAAEHPANTKPTTVTPREPPPPQPTDRPSWRTATRGTSARPCRGCVVRLTLPRRVHRGMNQV